MTTCWTSRIVPVRARVVEIAVPKTSDTPTNREINRWGSVTMVTLGLEYICNLELIETIVMKLLDVQTTISLGRSRDI